MNWNLANVFLIFLIYSFLGYLCEVIFCSFYQKKLVNRGFLFGPYCPIYGIGSLFITYCLSRFKEDPVVVFILGSVITSCLEYFTSFVLEKIFHNKWWDYSSYKCNLNGRICLQNTLLFGLGSLVVIYLANPRIFKLVNKIPSLTLKIISLVLMLIFIIDIIYSMVIAYNLRNRIIICEELKKEKLAKLPGMLEKLIREKVHNFKTYPKRLLEAFPNLKNSNFKEFELMKKLKEKAKRESKKKKFNKK